MGSEDARGRHCLVFHPDSGRGAASTRAAELADGLKGRGLHAELIDASLLAEGRDRVDLRTARAVIVIGGDGLIHHVIQILAGTKVPLGIIPAGSGNDTWRMEGLQSAEESMHTVIDHLAGELPSFPIDLLETRFDGEPGRSHYVVGAVSWGFEASVNARANALPRWLGAARYPLGLLLSLSDLRPHPTTVSAPGMAVYAEALTASVANIRSIGGGIPLFSEATWDDGLANLVMVKGPRIRPALRYLPQILRGRPHPYRLGGVLTHVRVNTDRDCYADGEFIGRGSFELTVRHTELHLIGRRT